MSLIPGASALARLRSLWRGARERARVEADMSEEFRHHLDLRAEDLVRRGLTPAAARRRARIEFGHVEGLKEDARASRGLGHFDQLRFSWLDVKLGARMLVKYPVLSLVSVLGMAVAIAIGAGGFGVIQSLMDPALPLAGGERIVSLQNNTTNPGNPHRQILHDFVVWRSELKTVDEVSAMMSDARNFVTPDGEVVLVRVSQMSASGFRVAGVPPLLGRWLLDDDERAGALPVAVIGHDEWQRSFDADPAIIGRQIQLGTERYTVVGVMPAGFRFPLNDRFWTPLRLNPNHYDVGSGPPIHVFGRLADGASLRAANAELKTIGARLAAAYPETHAQLRPIVMRYAHAFGDVDSPVIALAFRLAQVGISMLLVLVAVNVGVLIYARTATRSGEIAVRSALGASRRRIVVQLFAEALVMSVASAVIGLSVAAVGLAAAQRFFERTWRNEMPFWLELGMSPALVAYVAGLAIVAGVIVGVLPALKATGRRVQSGLQQLSARGSQMQLGRTWTALIVTQVAIAVAVLPFALYIAGKSAQRGTAEAGYPADQILRAYLSVEQQERLASKTVDADTVAAQYRMRAGRLIDRLDREPGIAATFSHHVPGFGYIESVEVEGEAELGYAATNAVGIDMFPTFSVQPTAGRNFEERDTRPGAHAVIVDRVFAEKFAGGGNAVGRRVRFVTFSNVAGAEPERGPWHEIVGVVPDFLVPHDFDPAEPKLYRPLALAEAPANIVLTVRVRGLAANSFTQRLRAIAAEVDPGLLLYDVRSLGDADRLAQTGLRYTALGILVVTLSVLLLSSAGIYAMMSFTVAKRRREIGIRSALGAGPQLVIRDIFKRAGAQLGAGVVIGLAVAYAIDFFLGYGPLAGRGVLLLPGVAALMMTVGLVAAFMPVRQCLRIQPTEALREE